MVNEADETFDKHIQVHTDEAFSIDLESNPTTGYEWIVVIKGKILLKNRKLLGMHEGSNITNDTSTIAVGGGWKERFTFHPLEQGEALIIFQYKRAWDIEPLDQKSYHILIKPQNENNSK